MKPSRWNDVFDGPEERAFFIGKEGAGGLARSGSDFVSIAELALTSGLDVERVRELVAKYKAAGLVVESPANPGHYGYWHRVVAGSDTFRLRRGKKVSSQAGRKPG